MCWGFGAAIVAAYTIRPPAEGYEWYLSSVQPILLFLASAGVGAVARAFPPERGVRHGVTLCGCVAACVGLSAIVVQQDRRELHDHKFQIEKVEGDREAAGRWIAAHTPADATVLTGFGNIAYSCHRRVIDYSFLNRKPPIVPYKELIERLQPDVVSLCHWGFELPVEQYPAPPGYHVAAVFDSAARSGVNHFFAVVMLKGPGSRE